MTAACEVGAAGDFLAPPALQLKFLPDKLWYLLVLSQFPSVAP